MHCIDAASTKWRFLRADLSVRCPDDSGEPTPEYSRLYKIGIAAIVAWPAGVPLLFLGLLLKCRKQLSRRAP